MKKIMTLMILSCILSGCGTMFAEKSQKITFTSKPDKAEVTIGTKTCITPCALSLDKKQYHVQAVVTKDGFASQSIILVPQFEPWTWLNCLGNMCMGMVVDYMTGTIFKYEPEYHVILSRNSSGGDYSFINRAPRYESEATDKEVSRGSTKATAKQEAVHENKDDSGRQESLANVTVLVRGDKVKLRKKPSAKATVLKTLKKGQQVQIIKTTENWCLVEIAGGETGWCPKSSLAQKKE